MCAQSNFFCFVRVACSVKLDLDCSHQEDDNTEAILLQQQSFPQIQSTSPFKFRQLRNHALIPLVHRVSSGIPTWKPTRHQTRVIKKCADTKCENLRISTFLLSFHAPNGGTCMHFLLSSLPPRDRIIVAKRTKVSHICVLSTAE